MSFGRVIAATIYLYSLDAPDSEVATSDLEEFLIEANDLAKKYRLKIDRATVDSLVDIFPGVKV